MARRTALARKQRDPEAFDTALANAQMAEVQRLAAAHTDVAVHALVEIASATKRSLTPNKDGVFEIETDEGGDPIILRYLPGPRATAAKALLEHAHGRPNQRLPQTGEGGDVNFTVVLQSFLPSGERVEIDVTPTPEEISGGADPPA